MEVVVTTGAVRRAKLQLNCHQQQTNTQIFTGWMPLLLTNQQCRRIEGKGKTITISPYYKFVLMQHYFIHYLKCVKPQAAIMQRPVIFTMRAKLSSTVYCKWSCLWVCLCVGLLP